MSNPEDQRPICMAKAFEEAHLSKKCACPQCAKEGQEKVEYQPEFPGLLEGTEKPPD